MQKVSLNYIFYAGLDNAGLVPLFGIDVWEHAYYLQVRWSTSLLIQLSPHSYRDVQRISSNMNIIKCIYTWWKYSTHIKAIAIVVILVCVHYLSCKLQYKNVRPDHVKSIWGIVNWKDVAERLSKAKAYACGDWKKANWGVGTIKSLSWSIDSIARFLLLKGFNQLTLLWSSYRRALKGTTVT